MKGIMDNLSKITDFLGKWFLIALGVIVGIFSFVQSFNIKVNAGIIIMVAVFFAAIFLGVLISKKKFKIFFVFGLFFALILFSLINAKALINGIYSISNSIIEIYGEYYGKDGVVLYDLKSETVFFTTAKAYNTLVLCIIAVVYAYILSLATSSKVCATIHIVLSVVFLIPGMVLGEVPGIIIVSLMIFYFLACYMFWHNKRVYPLRMVVLLLCCYIVTIIVYVATPPEEYYESGKFEKNKEKIDRIISNFKIDTMFESISDLFWESDSGVLSDSAIGGISGGELGGFESVEFKHIDMLNVRFEPIRDGIYLKGYACNEYMGDHWDVMTMEHQSLYENAFMNHAKLRTVDGLGENKMFVEYLSDRNEYRYVPYMNNLGVEDYFYDLYAYKKKKREYTYKYAGYSGEYYSKYMEENMNAPRMDHIFECYANISTDVPENIVELFDEILYEPVYYDYTPEGLDRTIQYVRDFLKDNTHYSLSPGKLEKGRDFVEDFLVYKRVGYCTSYATTATLMFRYLGIPARYAEGYLIAESDYKNKQVDGDGYVEMTVQDSFAHAWPEIYLQGVGFMPIEVTPSYYDDEGEPEKPQETTTPKQPESEKESSSDNPKETTTPKGEQESTSKEQTSSEIPGIDKDKDGKNDNNGISYLVIVILIVLLISSIVIYKLLEKKKVDNYNTEDLRHNVLVLYAMFVKYLKKIGIDFYIDNNILDVKAEIDKRIDNAFGYEKFREGRYITDADSLEVMRIMLKAKYSRENIQLTAEEYRKVRQYVEEFKKSLQYLKNKV